MAPRYNPPINGQSKQVTLLSLIGQVDPDFNAVKFNDFERYEGEQLRPRRANPHIRGPYNDHSNVYPVGQQWGGDDAAKVAAKAPTEGNPLPGLYEGVATDGWA